MDDKDEPLEGRVKQNINQMYSIPTKDNDDSVIIIPDTPSPIFSRFAGKRNMFPDLDRSGLDNSRKKKRTSYDTTGQVNFHHHGNLNKKTSNKQINQGEIDLSTHRRDFMKNNGHSSSHKFVTKKRKSSDESLDCFNDLWEEYTSNTNSPSWNRNKSAKKMLNLKNGKEVSNFDNQNLFEENKFHDPNSKTKFKMETVTQNTDVNMSSESRIENNAFKPAQNYLAEASTSRERDSYLSTKLKQEDSQISDKFSQLRMARQKKLEKSEGFDNILDNISSDEYIDLIMPQRKKETFPKLNYNRIRWPSDSESNSESENSDTVPLREILGGNLSEKKKKHTRDLCEQMLKNKNHVKNSQEKKERLERKDLGRNNFLSKKDLKEKLASKSSTVSSQKTAISLNNLESEGSPNKIVKKDPIQNVSEQNMSIISVSSTDSHNLSHDMPQVHNEATEGVDNFSQQFSPLHVPPDSTNTFRPTFVSPRLPVPGSVRRGRHVDRWRDRYIDDVVTSPTMLLSSQMLPSSNVSPPARDLGSLSPHLLNRTRSVRSQKGRLSRPRNVSCERVTSHATEFTSASTLLTPRSQDATQQVRQHEADEDFARRLQEEMDMEFALSLQNMENRPPTDPTSSGGTTTRDEDSDTRAALSARSRMYGLEDIETYLNIPEDAVGNSSLEQMLRVTMATTPPRTRNRQRGSTRQRNSNSLEALSRIEAHLMSLLDEYNTPPTRGQGRRGRHFYPATPAEEGQDYEELLDLAEMIGEVRQRGLTKHQVTKLPERKYQLCPGEDVKDCLVCMCEFEDKDKLRILPCFHEFHSSCIDKWIMGNATCPVCRVVVSV